MFLSTATPPSRIAASKSAAVIGSTPVADSAPSSSALTSVWCWRAAARASKPTKRRLSLRAAASRPSLG